METWPVRPAVTGAESAHGFAVRIWVVPRKDAFRPNRGTEGAFYFAGACGIPGKDMMKKTQRPFLGMGLFLLFAAALLFGIRYGDRVIRRLGLEPPAREPLPILMYHKVTFDGYAQNDMTVDESKLRADFDYLQSAGYTPILPRELAAGETLPDKPVLITFDDGYVGNYTLLYPILQEYGFKALISPIVRMPDRPAGDFCSWAMLREMSGSGLVEIGSHTYDLHNMDGRGGVYTPDQPNGIQRRPGESDGEFSVRVLDDIQKSYDRLMEELGVSPTCFAYPYGVQEPDAQALIDALFPVTLITKFRVADLADGLHDLPRLTVTMDTPLSSLLK